MLAVMLMLACISIVTDLTFLADGQYLVDIPGSRALDLHIYHLLFFSNDLQGVSPAVAKTLFKSNLR